MLLALAWRESRNTRRRLLIYMSSISLGVAALVAIDSYSANIRGSVREQSRALLGGDLSISSRREFPVRLDSVLDSLSRQGIGVARVTTFASMALAQRSTLTRLVQVRAIAGQYPLYGEVITEPASAWREFSAGPNAIVDPTILTTLRMAVGDSLRIGLRTFVVSGVLRKVPGDPGVIAAIGPRVLIPAAFLEETQLLSFGSVAQREALLRLPPQRRPQAMMRQIRRHVDSLSVRSRTASQTEENLSEWIEELSDFLGLVGLMALLLGGIGVASGVHAHVARKVDTVAILRSIGATGGQVLSVYVVQAAAMGLIGAAIGALAGVAIQFALPLAARDFLPVDVSVKLVWGAIGIGLLTGGWIALAFALLPLLRVRRVAPLQALRRDLPGGVQRASLFDLPRLLVLTALTGTLTLVAVACSDSMSRGLAMSAGIAAVIVLLAIVAQLLSGLARRVLRRGWPYVVRQGVANLYRPGNQTRAVVLSIGFGAFLMATVYLVQTNLLRKFDAVSTESRGNLLLFDIQDDQAAGVDSILLQSGAHTLELTPIVTMRVAGVNGRTTREILDDNSREGRGWPYRREYRSTFRDSLGPGEQIVAGAEFGSRTLPPEYGEVSFELDLANDMRLAIGDTVLWDVQGVDVPTIVTSLRAVDWERLETNFFAVFAPGSIDAAPKGYALLAKVDEESLGMAQGRVVERYANVSAIDLTLVAETIAGIQNKVSVAIRFTAVFSLLMGIPVLVGAVAATRRDRIREGVLLRTLGASRAQVQSVLLSEYTVLGALGACTGVLLGIAGAWGVTTFIFEEPFVPFSPDLLILVVLMMLATAAIGFAAGRDAYRTTPAEALREGV
jgi:putative ABC transport system permease protein